LSNNFIDTSLAKIAAPFIEVQFQMI